MGLTITKTYRYCDGKEDYSKLSKHGFIFIPLEIIPGYFFQFAADNLLEETIDGEGAFHAT